MQSGAEYEFRVGATCEAERYGTTPSFAYADIQTFSIEKQEKSNENSYNCGIVPKIEITNQKPLASLIANEVFTAGDFPVQVLEAQGSNGIFSGKGFIKVPYLNDTKLSVSFENIKINTDNQLVEGIVKTEYDPSWGKVGDIPNIKTISEAVEFLEAVFKKQENTIKNITKLEKKQLKVTDSKKIKEIQQEIEEEYKKWREEQIKIIKVIDSVKAFPIISEREKQELDTKKQENDKANENLNKIKENNKEIVKIVKNVEKKEIENIAEINKLNKKEIFSIEEINKARKLIEQLTDEKQKAELYLKLQEKVPYHNQRDNESIATEDDVNRNSNWLKPEKPIGDIMCNLTSQAMAMYYLGITKPCDDCPTECDKYNQMEDYLECIRRAKMFDEHRGETKTRKKLSKLFSNISAKEKNIESYDKDVITNELKPFLEQGCGVILSSFGHIVRLQAITEEGLIVDDPYGKVVDFSAKGTTPKYKKDKEDYRNNKKENNGNDNVWRWEDLKTNKINIKYTEIYCKTKN